MPQPLTDGSGGFADTGVAQESTGNRWVESVAHERDAFPTRTLNGSFSYSVSWGANLEGSGPPFAPYDQDYNMGLGSTNIARRTASTNPVVTGLGPSNQAVLYVPGDPSSDYPTHPPGSPTYQWYEAGGGSQAATFQYTDWQNAGTWSISFTKSTNHANTTGTVSFYASISGADILLATMDSSTTAGAHTTITFSSTTSFGFAAPFRIKAVMAGMGGTWTGSWQYGYYDASDTLQVLNSGTNNFMPQGINWCGAPDPTLSPPLPTNNFLTSFGMTAIPDCQFSISGTRTGP
jgi:hypothetical protein